MKHLRYSILAVLVAVAFVFNVERLDLDEESVINISSFVYVLGFLVVTTPVLLRRVPVTGGWAYGIGVFWTAVYLASKIFVFRSHPAWGGVHTYVTVTELALVLVLSLLASILVKGLREFEEAVATLTLTEVSRKVKSVEQAHDDIQDRILLSRRHNRPLSVLVLGLDRAASAGAIQGIVEEIQRGMTHRYVVSTLANALVNAVRRTDLPLEQGEDGRFVVVCPETDAAGAEVAAHHVQKSLLSQLGVRMKVGIAAFPEDAFTFDELLRHAEQQLESPQPLKPLATSPSRA
jgi:GGDEF domain-containing protein